MTTSLQEIRDKFTQYCIANKIEVGQSMNPKLIGVADFFLSLIKERDAELVWKIKERQKLFNFIPQDEYGYKRIKTTDLDILALLTTTPTEGGEMK